jgi:dTDP-glucose 4,6-dehydratase/UDP-glucose 4,6-dehydratase
MSENEYKPIKILVTGGAGFIGSNFINYMLDTYPDIFILNIDKLSYVSNIKNIDEKYRNDSSRYKLEISDINNKNLVLLCLKHYSIDTIVHFAAESSVDNSFGNSLEFTFSNVLGTHTLLECARVYGNIQRFIHISTDEVFGEVDIDHEGCTEKSLLNPTNPYAATKAGAEFIVKSYYHSFKLPVIITRGNNVFGPCQYPEKLIPRFITKLLKGEKCPVQGSGMSRRNFIYVEDVAKAVDMILRRGEINNIYNIGSKDEYNVIEILKILMDRMYIDKNIEEVSEYVEDRIFNDFRYAIQTEKLESLGWKKETDFFEGINKTISYYKSQGFD